MTATKKKMKRLDDLGDPKSPAAKVSGQRMRKLPSLNDPKSPAAKVVGQRTRKMPPLSDPKTHPGSRGAGVSGN